MLIKWTLHCHRLRVSVFSLTRAQGTTVPPMFFFVAQRLGYGSYALCLAILVVPMPLTVHQTLRYRYTIFCIFFRHSVFPQGRYDFCRLNRLSGPAAELFLTLKVCI